MTAEQKCEGLAYAEKNFKEKDSHLLLDKTFIEEYYDLSDAKVLDFGCGMGGMTLWIDEHYSCDVKGIDIDKNHIEICHVLKTKYGKDHIQFLLQDILKDPLEEKFDYIFLNDVAEHIRPDFLLPIFKQLRKHLNEDGVIFVSYPPWEGPYASHLNGVFKTPWPQYWPKKLMYSKLKKRNKILVGEKDLMSEYFELNRLNHKSLKGVAELAGLQIERRMSHSKLNRLPGFQNVNSSFSLLKYFITKELVVLRSAS
ncbi:SAM-dependent methyltransferase [Owenweeksia hongkongensis]|uniref:SAM-dependent methyltransferase n=1 Tax=Owenweeksia hongkongensis TaxID=253245 RepID=UPI003A9421CD